MLGSDGDGVAADVGGVLAVVHKGDGVAVEVGIADGGIEETVGVAAEDEVDATGAGDELDIVDEVVNLPAEVAEAYDDVATLATAQDGDDAVSLGNGVEVADAFAVLFSNEPFHGRSNAEDANANALALDDGVGDDNIAEASGADVVVAADGGEGGELEEAVHVLLAEVKLVVPDGGGIVVHGVHKADLRFATEKIVVEGALGVVAAVEEEKVGVNVGAETVYEGGTTDIAAGIGLGVGLDATVGVGGMEHKQGDRGLRAGEE